MQNIERRTKIQSIANLTGTKLHIGDLISHFWDACDSSRQVEGEIVDIARHRIAIQQLDGSLFWVFAGSILDSEIIERAN